VPKINYAQTNFTAGELSPRIYGRFDISRYANGAKTIRNGTPTIQGGVKRRAGTRWYAEVKDSTKEVRLVPFVFNRDQAYILEFGDLYARFFDESGQILHSGSPYEIATPYSTATVAEIGYSQGADTMFIAHTSTATRRLQRFAVDNWTLTTAPFETEPFDELGERPATGLTLSSAAVGTGISATAAAAAFLASDVGRDITYGSGRATITAYTSTTVVTVSVTQEFGSTSSASGEWVIESSPQTTCTPSAKDPVGQTVTLTLSAAGWRSTDVGKYVKVNRGLAKITAHTSATVVSAQIRAVMDATIGAPAGSWSLESSVWNATNGYPGACTLYQQRLYLAGSTAYPQTVWGSRIGEYLNFELGTLDDDAMQMSLSSDQINPITHIAQINALVGLTYGGEFTISGGVEKPIAPTNINVKSPSVYGCNRVRPIRAGNELLFWQRASRKLRALGYRFNEDTYSAPDIAVLADHLTEGGIVDMAYQHEPESIIWLVRADGVLISVTFEREQDVIAWAQHTTDGFFERVASIPAEDGSDHAWVVVRRTINGATKRYIERMDADLNTDSTITGANPAGATVWTGLDHLEGKTVDVVADGVALNTQVVTGGQITIERAAYAVEIGLHYKTTVVTLTPEIAGAEGTIQAAALRSSRVILRFLDTVGCKLNGDPIPFRQFGAGVLDSAVTPFTGDMDVTSLGFAKGLAELTIEQDQPYPWHLLAVIRTLTANQG